MQHEFICKHGQLFSLHVQYRENYFKWFPIFQVDKLNNAGKNAVMYAAEAGRFKVCTVYK